MIKKFFSDVAKAYRVVFNRKEAIKDLKAITKKKRENIKRIAKEVYNLENISTGDGYKALGRLYNELSNVMPEDAKKPVKKSTAPRSKDWDPSYLNQSNDIFGYTPASSHLYDVFPNPFGAYAFIARYHWAVRGALDIIRNEICSDGFYLKTKKGTSKKRLKEVYDLVKALDIPRLRLEMCYQLKLYGNTWLLPHKNRLKTKLPCKIEILSPTRIAPIFDANMNYIIGWSYRVGTVGLKYTTKEVMHLGSYSSDAFRDIGDPPLGPALVDIEADMAASSYNNQVFQKGGLMGIILSIKLPDDDGLGSESRDFANALQDIIDAQYVGGKVGANPVVVPYLDKVHNPSPIGKLDSSFKNLKLQTAKVVSICLGIPPEKLSVSRSESIQYVPALVEYTVNASFDKAMNALTEVVDDFINERIMKELLKIDDVMIQAGGRYGSLTKTAADTIKTLSDSGPIIDVNEARGIILGFEELPADDPRGKQILDNSKNRDAKSNPPGFSKEKPEFGFSDSTSSKSSEDNHVTDPKAHLKDLTDSPDDTEVKYMFVKNNRIKFYG